jgi:hypothetical protein
MCLCSRYLSALFAFVLSALCLLPAAAMAQGSNWQILGHFYNNDAVATALNDAGIGVGASVGLNARGTQFTAWGDDQSVVFPGYSWKSFGNSTSSESYITNQANDVGAVSTALTVNANGDWVLWAYSPD